ncbi:MAG TPA: globin family protein [Candidatus Limnocylindrales bacterium]|nr:globin family protein [Candidatus Limnocylindrales bacterium]
MTPRQQQLIQTSFGQVAPIADQAAIIFYDRLFELDPSIRPMFAHTDMPAQRRNLMQTLTVVVKSIDRLETIVPAVEALGRRHAGYGVQPSHFATVGAALLDTLSVGLGESFTPEVRDAWATAYGILADVMIGAMGHEAAAA